MRRSPVGSQFGFAEALVNPNAGRNRRLDAIDRLVDWAALDEVVPLVQKFLG